MRLPCQQTLPAVMLSFSQFLIWDDLVWIFKRNDTQLANDPTSSLSHSATRSQNHHHDVHGHHEVKTSTVKLPTAFIFEEWVCFRLYID